MTDMPSPSTAYRQLKSKLVNDGWWERNFFWEILLLIPIVAMVRHDLGGHA